MTELAGKQVLVTGSGGFIASHLCERLARDGVRTRALVHYNALGRRGWLDHSPLAGEMDIVAGDITDRDSVRRAMEGVEVVFHLAALIAIPYSYQAPASYLNVNAGGTLNVLQAARDSGGPLVVHTSTSEVYGSARHIPITEDHPLQGQSPYSASKIAADKMVEAFHCSFDLPVVTVRPFNTYGPRQSARAIVPAIIAQCLSGAPVIRLGALSPTRDLNYVDDTVSAFVAAATHRVAVGRAIHFGSGMEVSVGDLARRLIAMTGSDAVVEEDAKRLRPEKSEVLRLVADASQARTLLAWAPQVDLDAGLERTIAWARDHLDRDRPGQYVV